MYNIKYFHCIYGLSNVVPKKFRKTPSNARICTKRFRRSQFRTSMMSISQNFFDFCAKQFEKITKLIYVLNHGK